MQVTNEQVEMIANADPDAYEMVHDEELVVAMATELRQLRKLRDAMDAAVNHQGQDELL